MKRQYILLLFLAILLYSACASLQTPQGGPRDKEAPKILIEIPKNLTRSFKGNKISITFDEFFKLSNEYTEISISPSSEIPPTFITKQKTLQITFKDSLEKNTTYTINFGKAIQDINESNVLKNYSYVFSTGPTLDSLQIKGTVINSFDNKPVIDATVFIFRFDRDSLFGKKKPSLFTNTDSSGNFSLKNLRKEKYTLYALKEKSPDRIFNSSDEEIAFLKDPINLNKDTIGVILKLFKEVPEKFRIVDRKIEPDGKISIFFNKPLKDPSLSFIDAPEIKNPIIEFTSKGDTASAWLREIKFDSLKVAILDNKKPLDTLTFRRSQKDLYPKNILFGNNLSAGKIGPGKPLTLTFNSPIQNIDIANVVLLEDSVSKNNFTITKIKNSERNYQVNYPWKTRKRYTLKFKEEAIKDIYDTKNKELKLDFELDEIENYGNLSLNITKLDSTKNYILQLMTDKKILYKEFAIVQKNTTVTIANIPTNKFLVKVIEDLNKNNEFDTGNVKLKIQPEKSWFWDKEIVTRANWDREEKIEIPKDF